MTTTIAVEQTLRDQLSTALRASIRLRTRRPGLYQVNLPAFFADGDAATIFVRMVPRGILVTDLGTTMMRVGYDRKINNEVTAAISRFAENQGMRFEDGQVFREVDIRDLVAATLGLVQVQAQAETIAHGVQRQLQEATHFRETVVEFLLGIFGKSRVKTPFVGRADDEKLYTLDALIDGKRPIAIASVPNDLTAERAVASKLKLADEAPTNTTWLAIPRDIERLGTKTRRRLLGEFLQAGANFKEQRDAVGKQLKAMAA